MNKDKRYLMERSDMLESRLNIKSTAELDEQVKKELEVPDKTIASVLPPSGSTPMEQSDLATS